MKHSYFLYLLACAVVPLSGCATMINGTHQRVTIVSDPPETMVVIDSQHNSQSHNSSHELISRKTNKDFYNRSYVISYAQEFIAVTSFFVPDHNPKEWFLWMRLQPRAGCILKRDIVLGAIGEYNFVLHKDYEREPYYGAGYWIRYYPSFLDQFLKFRMLKSRIELYPYVNFDHMVTNFYSQDRKEGIVTGFNTHLLMPGFGTNYRLGKHFYLDIHFYKDYFMLHKGESGSSRLKAQLGISYFFL